MTDHLDKLVLKCVWDLIAGTLLLVGMMYLYAEQVTNIFERENCTSYL